MDTFIDSIVDSKPRRVRKSRVLRCTNCGRENGRQRTYCTRCGTVLRTSKKAATGNPPAGTRAGFGNEAMLIAVLLLLVAVFYLVYSSRQVATIPAPERAASGRNAPVVPLRGDGDEPAVAARDALPQASDSAPVHRRYDPATTFSDPLPAAPRVVRKPPASGNQRETPPLRDVTIVERPAAPTSEVPVAMPVPVQDPPKPTTHQQLRNAVDQCAGDILSRFVCEQKARIRYCDGQWGQWPECPGMPTMERGTGG